MDLTLPDEVRDYADATRQLLADQALKSARYGPDSSIDARRLLLERLREFGLLDLDVAAGGNDALVAAVVLEQLGRGAVALPAAAIVTGRAAELDGPLFAVGELSDRVMVDAVDLFPEAWAIERAGMLARTTHPGEPHPRILARSAGWASISQAAPSDPRWWGLHEILSGFVALGVVAEAIELSRIHLNEREQFGRQLKKFQALQHRFAEMVVFENGLRELCYYTLWAHEHKPETRITDALILRAYQLEATATVVRSAHQIHAAIGFCHEHPLIDLTTSTVLARQVPLTLGQTYAALEGIADEIETIFGERERARYAARATQPAAATTPEGSGGR